MEKWLLQVEHTMISSVRAVTADARLTYADEDRNKWVLEWPGQVRMEEDDNLMWQSDLQPYRQVCVWGGGEGGGCPGG